MANIPTLKNNIVNNVSNISGSFSDNVNYIAELDKQYSKSCYIAKSNIHLGTSKYFGKCSLSYFDRVKKQHIKIDNLYSGSVDGDSGLTTFLNSIKTEAKNLFYDIEVYIDVKNNTTIQTDKDIEIKFVTTKTILGIISIDIYPYTSPTVVSGFTKYSINSVSDNYISVLTYLSSLDDRFNDAIYTISEKEDKLLRVFNSIDNVDIVANKNNYITIVSKDLTGEDSNGRSDIIIVANDLVKMEDSSINIVASIYNETVNVSNNVEHMNTVIDNIPNMNIIVDNKDSINSVALNIVDINNADENANIARTKASEALDSQNKAKASEILSRKYSTELEDVEVENGEFSSFHWAQKAKAIAGGNIYLDRLFDVDTSGAIEGSIIRYSPSEPVGRRWSISTAYTKDELGTIVEFIDAIS